MRSRNLRIGAGLAGLLLLGLAAGLILAAGPQDALPPEKQALVDAANAFRQGGQPADKSMDTGRPQIAQGDTAPMTGMLGAVAAPMAGGVFTATNAWAGWIDPTTYVIVYAGAPGENPGQGLVLLMRRTGADGFLDPSAEPTGRLIPAPLPGGPLRIVRLDGRDLIIANPAGHEFRFDPVTASFE